MAAPTASDELSIALDFRPARAELRADFVATEFRAGRNGHFCGTAEGAIKNRRIERLILAVLSWDRLEFTIIGSLFLRSQIVTSTDFSL